MYFSLGLIALSKFNLNKENKLNILTDNFQIFILGFIIISVLALLLNFFLPLSKTLNSIIYILVFILALIFFKKKILEKKNIKFIFIITILTFFLILYSDVNRPDAYLYHLPYTAILNINEVIIGLNNINFRYGLISILQYTSAINVNFLFKYEGILIPSASIISLIAYFFYDKLKQSYITKKINLQSIFSLSIFIYIIYKVIRYSEFGNDALPALMTFFLISKILERDYIKKNLLFIYLLCVFIFLNKTTMIFLFLIPVLIFFLYNNFKSIREYFKIIFSLPTFIIIIWLFKNFLISGCLVYPLHYTCINTNWSNIQETKKVSIEAEAWSKAWPENKKKINFIEFNKNFNWIEAWSEKHLLHIIKIIAPFILCLLLILIASFKKTPKKKFGEFRFIIPLCVTFIGTMAFFIKFPLYRYGYGYIISLICLLFTIFISTNLNEEKFLKIIKIILIVSPLIFFGKQVTRIVENIERENIWPTFKKNLDNYDDNFVKILDKKELIIYKNSQYCYYSNKICTRNDINNSLKISKLKNYFVINIK